MVTKKKPLASHDDSVFAGSIGSIDDIIMPTYTYTSKDLEDDVSVPGEEDVVSNFEFHETVVASCPICGSEMKAKLLDKGSNGLLGDMQVTLHIISRLCECPKVYLRYDN